MQEDLSILIISEFKWSQQVYFIRRLILHVSTKSPGLVVQLTRLVSTVWSEDYSRGLLPFPYWHEYLDLVTSLRQ
jgi:hypothetical protein